MEPAVIPLLLALQVGTCSDPPLRWPLGSGEPECAVISAYAQLERSDAAASHWAHDGLDIAAAPGDPVYAIDAGTVRRVDDKDPTTSRIIVESAAGRALLYLHLAPGTIPFTLGDEVHVDDYLGDVANVTVPDVYDHLHMGVVSQLSPAYWLDYEAVADPLCLLSPGWDETPPTIADLPAAAVFDDAQGAPMHVGFRKRGSSGVLQGAASLAGQELDVIARVWDDAGANTAWKIIPRTATLRITPEPPTGAAALEWTVVLDHSTRSDPAQVYAAGDPFESIGWGEQSKRDFYLILTHGTTDDDGASGGWQPKPGVYSLQLTITDAADNTAAASNLLEIP